MLTTFQQQYAKPTRTVIGGIPATLFTDDVVLLCQTNLLPVTINLLAIASNWSPEYKIYVIDNSNNASVNNITINAPVGYTINGASSVVVNTNGGSLVIRAVSNTKYISQSSSGGGGVAGYTTIQDEGVGLPQRSIINFTGGGVTASDVGGKTQVDVIGGIIPITNANMLILISSNLVVPSQLYLITDAQYTDGGVVVMGLTSNSISLDGKGYFLNADYQAVGNYTGVTGFVANIGIWYSGFAGVVNIGDVVIWNNLHYKNLTGVWGTQPDTDLVNWQVLPKQNNTGYIFDIGFVKYNVLANQIIYRSDKFYNEIEYAVSSGGDVSFNLFPWGRVGYIYNKASGYAYFEVCNSLAPFFQKNVASNNSVISITYTNLPVAFGSICCSNNTVSGGSFILLQDYAGDCYYNSVTSFSGIQIIIGDGACSVSVNTISDQSNVTLQGMVNSTFGANNVVSNSTFTNGRSLVNSTFESNSILGYAQISYFDTLNGVLTKCVVENGVIMDLVGIVFNWTHTASYLSTSKSTFAYDLDFSLHWLGGVVTVPAWYRYIGIFTILNGTPLTTVSSLDYIPNVTGQYPTHPVSFQPSNATTVPFQNIGIGGAVANDICGNIVAVQNVKGRTNGTDYVEYVRSGNVWVQTQSILVN